MSPYDSDDLDEILSDVRRLLGEDGADGGDVPPAEPAAPSHKAVSDETQQYTPIHMPQHSKPVPPWEQPDFAGEYFGPENRAQVVRSASARAARPVETPTGGRNPQPKPSAAPPQSRSDAQRAVRRAQGPMSARQMFEDEDDDEDEEDDEVYERPRKKRKGRWIKRIFILLLILLVLAALVALVSKIIATQIGRASCRERV